MAGFRDLSRLSARAVDAAWKKGEAVKLQDGGNLVFQVEGVRKARWILRGLVNGKPVKKTWRYPEVGLEQARDLRAEWAKAYHAGTNPEAVRKAEARQERKEAEARALTFRKVALEYFGGKAKAVTAGTLKAERGSLVLHILPAIGDKPFLEMPVKDFADIVEGLDKADKPDMARRVASILSQVGDYACLKGYWEANKAARLSRLIRKRPACDARHHPALLKPEAVADALRGIWAFCEEGKASPHSRAALKLACYLPVRAQELVAMQWEGVDLETATARLGVSAETGTTKTGTKPTIPLPKQAAEMFRALWQIRTSARWCFPSGGKSGHLSGAGINKNLHLSGIAKGEGCLHGFRATFATLANEAGMPRDLADMTLGHKVGSDVSQAYNRSEQLEARRRALQWYADALDALREGRDVPAWKDYE